jgi:hypothetical protein
MLARKPTASLLKLGGINLAAASGANGHPDLLLGSSLDAAADGLGRTHPRRRPSTCRRLALRFASVLQVRKEPLMRAGTFDRFTVISRAFVQGTRWGCAFKIGKTEPIPLGHDRFPGGVVLRTDPRVPRRSRGFRISAKGEVVYPPAPKSGPDRPNRLL